MCVFTGIISKRYRSSRRIEKKNAELEKQQIEQAEVFGGGATLGSGEDKDKPKGGRKWRETKEWWDNKNNKGQVVQATGVARTVGTTGRLRNLKRPSWSVAEDGLNKYRRPKKRIAIGDWREREVEVNTGYGVRISRGETQKRIARGKMRRITSRGKTGERVSRGKSHGRRKANKKLHHRGIAIRLVQ